jgi:hypothetical protein
MLYSSWLRQFNWLFGKKTTFDKDGNFLNRVPLLVESAGKKQVYKSAQQHSNMLHRDRALKYNVNNRKNSKMYPLIPSSAVYGSPELQLIAQEALENRVFSNVVGVTPWKNYAGYTFTIFEYKDEELVPSDDQVSGTDSGYFWRYRTSNEVVTVFREKYDAELYAYSCGAITT